MHWLPSLSCGDYCLPYDIKRWPEGLIPSSWFWSVPHGEFKVLWVWCIAVNLAGLILLCFVLAETGSESQGKQLHEGCRTGLPLSMPWWEGCCCHTTLLFRALCSACGRPLKWLPGASRASHPSRDRLSVIKAMLYWPQLFLQMSCSWMMPQALKETLGWEKMVMW